jgi:hypothetical protein
MYGLRRGSHVDHAQFIFERLVNIMAGTLQFLPDPDLRIFLASECIPVVAQVVLLLTSCVPTVL